MRLEGTVHRCKNQASVDTRKGSVRPHFAGGDCFLGTSHPLGIGIQGMGAVCVAGC